MRGFLEHRIEVTATGHLNPYSLGEVSPWRGAFLSAEPPAGHFDPPWYAVPPAGRELARPDRLGPGARRPPADPPGPGPFLTRCAG
jgi:hypothetical protein